MSQIKNRTKITAQELNEMEINNMPDKEFKVVVIKILQDLRRGWRISMRPSTKRLKKKKNQLKMNSITEITNTLERINSRLEEAEEQISELEDRVMESNQGE